MVELNGLSEENGPVVISLVALAIFCVVVLGFRMAEPRLARTALGARIAKYLLIAVRSWTFGALVLVVVWALDIRDGRGDLRAALEESGLHARLPADQVALLVPSIIAHTLVNMFGASFRVPQRARETAESGTA